jgi:hypothetical protein
MRGVAGPRSHSWSSPRPSPSDPRPGPRALTRCSTVGRVRGNEEGPGLSRGGAERSSRPGWVWHGHPHRCTQVILAFKLALPARRAAWPQSVEHLDVAFPSATPPRSDGKSSPPPRGTSASGFPCRRPSAGSGSIRRSGSSSVPAPLPITTRWGGSGGDEDDLGNTPVETMAGRVCQVQALVRERSQEQRLRCALSFRSPRSRARTAGRWSRQWGVLPQTSCRGGSLGSTGRSMRPGTACRPSGARSRVSRGGSAPGRDRPPGEPDGEPLKKGVASGGGAVAVLGHGRQGREQPDRRLFGGSHRNVFRWDPLTSITSPGHGFLDRRRRGPARPDRPRAGRGGLSARAGSAAWPGRGRRGRTCA